MFIFGEIFQSLAFLVNVICTILIWLLIARIVCSWLPVDPYNTIVMFLMQATDPILRPFRRIPLRVGMMDLTPILAFAAIYFVRNILVGILIRLANQLGA